MSRENKFIKLFFIIVLGIVLPVSGYFFLDLNSDSKFLYYYSLSAMHLGAGLGLLLLRHYIYPMISMGYRIAVSVNVLFFEGGDGRVDFEYNLLNTYPIWVLGEIILLIILATFWFRKKSR